MEHDLAQLVRDIPANKIFSVKFIKRTNGEERVMLCRKGVTLGLADESPSYDPSQRNLVFVLDMERYRKLRDSGMTDEAAAKQSRRSINLNSILEVHTDGKVYK